MKLDIIQCLENEYKKIMNELKTAIVSSHKDELSIKLDIIDKLLQLYKV